MKNLLWLILLGFSACSSNKSEVLTIATSSNMQYAIKDLTEAFSAATQVPCETVVSSSGKLTAQIQQGAPLDVFLSADAKYPRQLITSGHATGPVEVYALGRLILWSNTPGTALSLDSLAQSAIPHIAIANPQTAPYGEKAWSVMEALNEGKIVPKLVYGESVAQTNQFILSRAATIGITGQSVAFAPEFNLPGNWVWIDTSQYEPIAQSMVLLSSRPSRRGDALKFKTFLRSVKAQEILQRYGYLLPGD